MTACTVKSQPAIEQPRNENNSVTAVLTSTAEETSAAPANLPSATPTGERPTDILSPTATGQQVTASPVPTLKPTVTPTSAPHVNVAQNPYAASDCSDKYPCNDDVEAWESRIQVPAGFQAVYYSRVLGQPTSITFDSDALLYVALQEGQIVTIDGEGSVEPFMDGFNTPTGIAFRPGTMDLYVSDRLLNENTGGEAQISMIRDGVVRQIFGEIPCCYTFFHSANGIAFGPDGYGYVGVGARADHGEILDGPRAGEADELHPWEATILRFSPDGDIVEPYASGLRNAYDLAWDVEGRLYATDNAPDFGPPDELHRISPDGQHGYPWYECEDCFDPPDGVEVIPSIYDFVPHAAAAGIVVYDHEHFPGYFNNLFVALWSAFEGAQKVMRFGPDGDGASDFATGFAAPIDVAVGPDGNLYVADWATGIIFQISLEQ